LKKRLVSLLCALFILSICSISYASDGHELPWGKDFSTFKNLTFSHESNDIKYYVVKGEKVCEVTKVAAAKVTYAFKGGKLYARIVNIFDSSDLDKLYKHFSDSFGKSKVSTQDGWTVNKWTKGDVKIKLKEDIEGTVHKLTMYYMPLAN
jgi:hypothetical protein